MFRSLVRWCGDYSLLHMQLCVYVCLLCTPVTLSQSHSRCADNRMCHNRKQMQLRWTHVKTAFRISALKLCSQMKIEIPFEGREPNKKGFDQWNHFVQFPNQLRCWHILDPLSLSLSLDTLSSIFDFQFTKVGNKLLENKPQSNSETKIPTINGRYGHNTFQAHFLYSMCMRYEASTKNVFSLQAIKIKTNKTLTDKKWKEFEIEVKVVYRCATIHETERHLMEVQRILNQQLCS